MLKEIQPPKDPLNISGVMSEEPHKKINQSISSLRPQDRINYSSFVAIQKSPFVAIQPSGIKPPFYACGHHPRLISLARAVGINQPFYKMDPYALLEERLVTATVTDMRIEELAHYFVSKILTSQPGGPYYLGGGCEGAIIAFEIAQQLEARGHRIAMLVIWDTPVSQYWPNVTAARFRLIRRLQSLFSGSSRVEFKRQLSVLIDKAKSAFIHAGADRSSHSIDIEQVLMRAARNYVAKSYRDHIILFRASESDFECSEPTLGWGALAKGGVDVHMLNGNHTTYFEQNFENFAEMLRTCLAQAQASVPCG